MNMGLCANRIFAELQVRNKESKKDHVPESDS